MGEVPYNFTLLTRYLLGDLSQGEQEQLEEQFFSDNDLFIELLDAEDQLVSDYLNGHLAPIDCDRFERRFLTLPGRRRSLEVACFLRHSLPLPVAQQSESDQPTGSWWQSILAALRVPRPLAAPALAALLIAVVIGSWTAIQFSSKKDQTHLGAPSSPPLTGSSIASITLKPDLFRDAGTLQKAFVGPGTEAVELRLESRNEHYHRYRASLRRADQVEVEVLADSTLKAETTGDGRMIVVWKVPVAKLPDDDYLVKLSGIAANNSISPDGTYHFKVRRQ